MRTLELFSVFCRIGAFTLGGGYAMIPLIQREVVDNKKWLEEEEFMNMIALAQAAPGVIAVNSAIFIGYRISGWKGLIASVLGAILPSFVIILLIAMVFRTLYQYPLVEAIMKGVRPAVVGLLAAAVIRMIISFVKTLKSLL